MLLLRPATYQDTNKVVLPIGIGCSGVSEKWLCRYYEIIKKFAQDISHKGIHCYIAVRKQHLYAIDRYVSKRCSQKAQLQLKELKSLAWKDVDERWFNDLINKKEEKKKRSYYTILREVIVQKHPQPLTLLVTVPVVVMVIITKPLWMLIMLMSLMMLTVMMMMNLSSMIIPNIIGFLNNFL